MNVCRMCITVLCSALIILSACTAEVPPEIISVSPAFHEIAGCTVPVVCTFSKTMDTAKTISAFTLSGKSGVVSGTFSFDGSGTVLTFIPSAPLDSGTYYTLTISSDAASDDKQKMQENYYSGFYAGEIAMPEVRSVFPVYGELAAPINSFIKITFSLPMDTVQCENAFSSSPGIAGTFSWNAARTEMTFTPYNVLDAGTDYTIQFDSTACDDAGTPLNTSFRTVFRTATSYTRPYLTSVIASPASPAQDNWAVSAAYSEHHGISPFCVIDCITSEPVTSASFVNALSITPSAGESVEMIDSMHFKVRFPSQLASGTRYMFVIRNSLTSTLGNTMAADSAVYFTTDGVQWEAPALSTVSLIFGASGSEVTTALSTSVLNSVTKAAANSGVLVINFSEDIKRETVPDNVTISYVNGPNSSFSGSATAFTWDNNHTLRITLAAIGNNNVYKITLSGGLSGITGTNSVPLKEDAVYYFRCEL